MDNLMFSLNATLPVFLVMVIGWALGQKGFLPKQFCTVADKLVFKVTLPVMLFCDMATLDLAHSFDAKFVLFCFAVTAIAIVVIWVLARRLLKDKTLVGEFVQASYRSSAAIHWWSSVHQGCADCWMRELSRRRSVPAAWNR